MNRALGITGAVPAALAGLALAGLRVKPAPFLPVPSGPETENVPLPEGLPPPVERYYRLTYGDRVPVLSSGVLSGRGTMRLGPVPFPVRMRFMHTAERNFRACFEVTLFGRPIIVANEHFVGGKFRQELTMGVEEGEPKNDHSAAIRMWSEWILWLPAMVLADPDARWEPVDDESAFLVVPYEGSEERLLARFDGATGKLQYVEGMKYKRPRDTQKTLWANAIWLGDKPWIEFEIEESVYNVEVDTSLEAKGPEPTGTR